MYAPGGGLGDTETLSERDTAGYGVPIPGARPDLALNDPGRLEVTRDAAQVVKIIHA